MERGSVCRVGRGWLAVAVLVVLGACGSPPAPTGAAGLAGTWSVTGSSLLFGVEGPMVATFTGTSNGTVRFVGRFDVSGVTTCRTYAFTAIDDDVLVLHGTAYGAEAFNVQEVDASTFELTAGAHDVTLSRLNGTPPVDDCSAVSWTIVAQRGEPVSVWSNLVGTADALYFNEATAGDPVVGYDVATAAFGPPRTFTVSVGGGVDRFVVAADDDDVFYGHCACGGSPRLSRFDLASDAHLVQVDSASDLGAATTFRYGVMDRARGHVIVGGRSLDDSSINRLFVLDALTLALVSERTVLPNVTIADLALVDDRLYALLGGGALIVEIGADGKALTTWEVPRSAFSGALRGIEAVGDRLYVLVDDPVGEEATLAAIVLE